MAARLHSLPLFVVLMGIGALAMLGPAVYAFFADDLHSARVFLYSAVLFFLLSALIGIATINNPRRSVLRSHLLALPGAYLLLPVMLAVPFHEAVQNTRFLNAYFEMVSSLTTTGATLFDDPGRIGNALHLWRAIVGWLGGLFIWVSAIAILEPLNLGGFEVTASGGIGAVGGSAGAYPARRLGRHAMRLAPVYAGLTAALWLFLTIVGEDPFVALCHAMSTLATSGISPLADLSESTAGLAGEALLFVFFFFAISRLTFAPETQPDSLRRLSRDPEFRVGLLCVLCVAGILFLRHWAGAHAIGEHNNLAAALGALWGALFTVLSFLSTSGFESASWDASRAWSGLPAPGLILVGLAAIGGGVATTAGGVKLLRFYALYKHGAREIERLIHPSSVGGSGSEARHLRNQGAYRAWVFFMLFALSAALVMAALSLTGLGFDESVILTVSALSTTGPLAEIATESGNPYIGLGDAGKLILGAAMILGRLETLAIIALISPEFWRS